ncbi:MAG: D-arabinono-1,4-lactone oxidase [Chloroflexota bacterium]
MSEQQNWAGNRTYQAARWHTPETAVSVQEIVRGSNKLKTLGSRHSFNTVADTTSDMVDLQRLDKIIVLSRDAQTVTIEGGVTYTQLCQFLQEEGFALHNLASLPHISVAGACATGTHGSGSKNGGLATAVSDLTFITASGDPLTLTRADDVFLGALVHLGGLGVVAQLTLDVEPAYEMRQTVYRDLDFEVAADNFEAVMESGYSVSLFTNWQNGRFDQLWLKQRATEPPTPAELFGAKPAIRKLHPIAKLPAEPCTEQLGQLGPWHERLPHFRPDNTPSAGAELQSEYFVPREHSAEALRAVAQLGEQLAPQLMVSEVRTIAADELWLSPFYKRPSCAIHFTWQRNWPAVKKLLPLIETALAPFDVRPHWGKLFTIPPTQLQASYPKYADFQQLLAHYDPQGKFRNAFMDTYFR